MKPGWYWLTKDEKKLFIQTLRDLRVPYGFSSNWKNIVSSDFKELKNKKPHDYHVLMQHLLFMLIQHAFKDKKKIRDIIISLLTFFSAPCSKVVDIETLMSLERGMAKTLCKVEKKFPPSVFVVMMHLPIHLAYESRVNGHEPF
ncbi:hypothetical protein GIB67_002055 [Kingdonia uniflora]|uniref:DUF4218 domain-containing protein n=1 Tax=Kingdonia uniflora TaxID=39325 RepID=A0A7J7KWL9_9MAGN|nr:hypothetical protein GIB67_002055 [Kingdonia uniflora]